MTNTITKVVTEGAADGSSVFTEQATPVPCTLAGMPGAEIINLWGTSTDGLVVGPGDEQPASELFPFFPDQGGTRFVVVRFWPDTSTAMSNGNDRCGHLRGG